jgi:hypothetical protein
MSIYVAFSDESKVTITSVFSCPQDITIFPYQAALEPNDSRYKAFYTAQPSVIQEDLTVPTTSSN